jgi:hypothetical protein
MAIRSVPRHGCEDIRTCVTCLSPIGSPCHKASGYITYAHKRRRRPTAIDFDVGSRILDGTKVYEPASDFTDLWWPDFDVGRFGGYFWSDLGTEPYPAQLPTHNWLLKQGHTEVIFVGNPWPCLYDEEQDNCSIPECKGGNHCYTKSSELLAQAFLNNPCVCKRTLASHVLNFKCDGGDECLV